MAGATATLGLPFGIGGAPGGNTGLGLPFTTSGAPASTRGIDGLNNLAVNTVVRPNSYIGLNSFNSVMAHYVVIPNTNAVDDPQGISDARDLGLSMLCFARDSAAASSSRHHRPSYGVPTGGPTSKNTTEMKELTQLNAFLERNSHYYNTASEILAEWKLIGVIKTEAAPASLASQATPYGSASSSRIVNLVVGYRVACLNYWSTAEIYQTQRLFLIIKKTLSGVWQITPWTDPNKSAPTFADLSYRDKDGTIHVGEFIYVGKSSDQHIEHVQKKKYMHATADMNRSLVKQGMLGTIEIYIGI